MASLEAKIFTMTKIVDLIRMLPEEIFSNIEIKQNMQAAASECLDNLIEEEAESEISESIDAGGGGFGILEDLGFVEISPKVEPTTPTKEKTVAKPIDTQVTADFIIEKMAEKMPGQVYGNIAELMQDVQALSDVPNELHRLVDRMTLLKHTEFKLKTELANIESYALELLELSKSKHSTGRRNITVKGK
ncbi:hypothetical protein ACH42_06445 [Endozoicomonas sp. (ex Bugula neritina AB1)]|nr:hypothetical protein ACH42_06445 [Endozoicomonas sp. (ex Bugula neritina AB1)]